MIKLLDESLHNQRYGESAKMKYNSITNDDILSLTSKLSANDMMHPDKVNKILVKYKQATSSCYAFSAVVAKLMDYYGISYKCYSGLAFTPSMKDYNKNYSKSEIDKLPDTHVWIESNGKYYEYYNGENKIKHARKSYEIKFK